MPLDLPTVERELSVLWAQAQAGDAAGYRLLLQKLALLLRGYLRRRLSSQPDTVEDLVQETLLTIHQKRHTHRAGEPLTAWVHAIARYKWIDHLRSHQRREALHDDIDDWQDSLVADNSEPAQDSQRELAQLLAQLPDKQRQAIECTRLQGLSVQEAAQATGQSMASIKVNVHRGLKAMASLWRNTA